MNPSQEKRGDAERKVARSMVETVDGNANGSASGTQQNEERTMVYLISLGAGILAGVLYGLINVRSPAPPAIALVGLLGMLVGEQSYRWPSA